MCIYIYIYIYTHMFLLRGVAVAHPPPGLLQDSGLQCGLQGVGVAGRRSRRPPDRRPPGPERARRATTAVDEAAERICYRGFYSVCDHGKRRIAKRYNFRCILFLPSLSKKLHPKIVLFSKHNSLYNFTTQTK